MVAKFTLLALSLILNVFVPFVDAVVKPRPAASFAATKEWATNEGECTVEERPFMTEIYNVLTEEECRMHRYISIQGNSKNGKIPVPKDLMQRVLAAMDQAEGRPTTRELKDTDGFKHAREDDQIVLARRRKLRLTTVQHTDVYIEGDHELAPVTGHSAFVFLNTNKEAYFEHGGIRYPVEAGKMLLFASDVLHHTVITQGEVDILGAFHTEKLYAVQGSLEFTGIYVDGEDATSSPGPNITVGKSVELTVELNAACTQQGIDVQETTGLGSLSCPNSTLGGFVSGQGCIEEQMNCTLTFTREAEGAYEGSVNGTFNTFGNDRTLSDTPLYFSVVKETEKEEPGRCDRNQRGFPVPHLWWPLKPCNPVLVNVCVKR